MIRATDVLVRVERWPARPLTLDRISRVTDPETTRGAPVAAFRAGISESNTVRKGDNMGSCDYAGRHLRARDARVPAACTKNAAHRRTRIGAAVIAVGAAILLSTAGAHAESATKNAWSLFSSLSLKFFETIVPHPAYSIVAGWALQVIGQQIGPGGGVTTDPAVLAALDDIKQQLGTMDLEIKKIKGQLETTKEEVKKEIDVAQFNIISAQLKDPVTRIETLSDEYQKHWLNKDWIQKQSTRKLSDDNAAFLNQIRDYVPHAVQTIHAVMVGGGGSPGLLAIWTKKTSYDLLPADDAVSAAWLHRAGLVFMYYAAIQAKALLLEAERLQSYKDASYNPDDEVQELKAALEERLLQEIQYLPYGPQWGASWNDHLPEKSDLFVDMNTGYVWTTAKAITGKQDVWLGWPDGNNTDSAPTLGDMYVFLQREKLHLPNLAEFSGAFRAYVPWRKKHQGADLGEFLAAYLGDAFTYVKGNDYYWRDRNIEMNDGEPLIPCIWLDTPQGEQSMITTTVVIQVPVPQGGRLVNTAMQKKADDFRQEGPIRVRDPGNPNDLAFHTRRPERECTVVAFRYNKIDGTPVRR
jgi:hypothetical protein